MPRARDVRDDWDFYPCRVDDAEASISLNLWHLSSGPLSDCPQVYWVAIEILRPGPHGMGAREDAEVLWSFEDRVMDALAASGLVHVGRLRNDGRWQLVFYGAPGLGKALESSIARAWVGPPRKVEFGEKADPNWEYYFAFLAPDEERMQWIMDRRVVEQLRKAGDPLTKPRRVDHWVYFASVASAIDFLALAGRQGFKAEGDVSETDGTRRYGVRIYRTDSVEHEDIHEVAMTLTDLASRAGDGEYDGWETSVEAE